MMDCEELDGLIADELAKVRIDGDRNIDKAVRKLRKNDEPPARPVILRSILVPFVRCGDADTSD